MPRAAKVHLFMILLCVTNLAVNVLDGKTKVERAASFTVAIPGSNLQLPVEQGQRGPVAPLLAILPALRSVIARCLL
jgi:hypothetical protein